MNKRTESNCICDKKKYSSIKTNFPSLSHYHNSHGYQTLHKCLNCSICFKKKFILKKFFKTEKYFLSQKNNSTNYKRAILIKDIIFKNKKNLKSMNILDIGCNDLKIYNLLKKDNYNFKYYGLDINIKKRKTKNLEVINSSIDKLNAKKFTNFFDIVIISHTLNYFQNLSKNLNKIHTMTKENKKVYVILPDINKNPLYMLMDDQKYFISKIDIKNICKKFNFDYANELRSKKKININSKLFFGREVFISMKKKNKNSIFRFQKHNNEQVAFSKISKIYLKLKKLDNNKKTFYSLYNLGINSLFVYKVLKDKIKYFFSPSYTPYNLFLGKKIIKKKYDQVYNLIVLIFSNKKLLIQIKKKYKKKAIIV